MKVNLRQPKKESGIINLRQGVYFVLFFMAQNSEETTVLSIILLFALRLLHAKNPNSTMGKSENSI